MQCVQNDPVYIRLNDVSPEELGLLRSILAYKNLSIQYQYNQARKNKYLYQAKGEVWHQHVLALKEQIPQTALFEDGDGYYTYAGLLNRLQNLRLVDSYTNNVQYPDLKPMAWDLNYTPLESYPYQKEALEALLAEKHASIEISTGGGKSQILENIIKNTNLKTVVVAPFAVIANQLYDQLVKAFGKSKVGLYGDGRKQFSKQITVAIAASLVRLADKPDCEAKRHFQEKELLLADEAHLMAAETLVTISENLCKAAPYRYYVSATPTRTDGKDLLLEGIISKIVYKKEFKELAASGYLSPLKFKVFKVDSDSSYAGTNAVKNKQEHQLYNPQILSLAAEVVNMKRDLGESVLVLVDELEQIQRLRPLIRHPFEVASSETDVASLVEKFNNKEVKLILGTSAISTGSNLKPLETLLLLVGGKSVIKIKQAIGRATRLYPGKRFATIVDFWVENNYQLSNHLDERLMIYQTLSDDIEFIENSNG